MECDLHVQWQIRLVDPHIVNLLTRQGHVLSRAGLIHHLSCKLNWTALLIGFEFPSGPDLREDGFPRPVVCLEEIHIPLSILPWLESIIRTGHSGPRSNSICCHMSPH